nr:hypothetical protein [Tanacetum cinerariifolium]
KDYDSTAGQSSKVKKKNNVSTGEPSKISKATKESVIPCMHAVAGYLHMKMDPELGDHAFMMDQEALAETLRADEAEQAAIKEI